MKKICKTLLADCIIASVLLFWSGCKGAGGVPVVVGPGGYESVRSRPGAPFAVVFPGRAGFAIHNKSSGQAPGPNGTAQGESDATRDGKASCKASATQGGSAWGGFALGAALVNESDEPLTVAVTCDIQYEYMVRAGASSGGRKTAAKMSLQIEARERTTGKVLFEQPLANLNRYEGDVQWSGQQRVQFDAMISAKAQWQIVLHGQVRVKTSEDGEGEADLLISGCKMTVAERARSVPTK